MHVTEVPEYLLERSRQRRAALGLPGGGAPAGDGDAAPAPASTPVATATAPAPEEAGPQPATAASATTVVTEEPVPVAAVDTGPRSGIPVWMMPVLLILPFWAMVYMGAFAGRNRRPAAGGRTSRARRATGCGEPTGGSSPQATVWIGRGC